MLGKNIWLAVAVFAFTFSLNSYGFGKNSKSGDVCHIQEFGDEVLAYLKKCKSGDLFFFQPPIFGNEQLPLIVVYHFCDFDHPIVHSKAGVVCIFTVARKHLWQVP